MTAATATRPGSWFGPLYGVFLRGLATQGRLLIGGALGVTTVLFAVLARDDDDAVVTIVDEWGLAVAVPIVSLVMATATLGSMYENESLVYVWLRPVHQAWIVLAAYLASLTVALPLLTVTLGLAAAVNGEADLVIGIVLGSALLTMAYCAVFTMLGLLTTRPLPWGLGYVLIWEGFLARAGRSAAAISLRAQARSVVSAIADVDLSLGDFALWIAVVTLLGASVAGLGLATFRLMRMQIP